MKKVKIFMPEDHMEQLYSSGNFFVRFVHKKRIECIAEEFHKIYGARDIKTLDAGCGEGHLLELLYEKNPNARYYGIDITGVALRRAAKRAKHAKLYKRNLLDSGFADGSFDCITCTEVIEHIPEYDKALKEFNRILAKGGVLIITFPYERLWTLSRLILGRRPIKVPDHVNSFNFSKLEKDVGLKVVKRIRLPFGLLFLSLNGIIIFVKNG